MEEFNNKLYSTINFVKERKIGDSFKTKYLAEVDEIKNSNIDNILQLKTFINRLDDIQRLAIMHEQPIQIIEESSSTIVLPSGPPLAPPPLSPPPLAPPPLAPPPLAPPGSPPLAPPSGPPPLGPPSSHINNEVKQLRYEFGNFVTKLAKLVRFYHSDSYFSSTVNSIYSQADTDEMNPDFSTTDYFLRRLSTDKSYISDEKGIFDFDAFIEEVKKAFDDILAKLTVAENELDIAKTKLKKCDEELNRIDDKYKN